MKTWGYVRAVLWSFFGIRRNAAANDELSHAQPLVLVLIALALAVAFGVSLYGLAQVAVRAFGP